MSTIDILNQELLAGHASTQPAHQALKERYRHLAQSYALLENAIAVLSDMRTNESDVYYGGFTQRLDIGSDDTHLPSIWEEDIFKRMHPDDLDEKHLQELCFYHFIKRQPATTRTDFYLMSQMRMRSAKGTYIPVLHRMFYIYAPSSHRPWLALCLYSALVHDMTPRCVVVNSAKGDVMELGKREGETILSDREKQILALIHQGLTSKEIAARLFISVNTVSRHRQDILAKLRVKNSIEACRMGKTLGVI